MKAIHITILLAALAAIMTLTSCDPLSSVDYKIHNATEDTVTVTMYEEIFASSYQGYTIEGDTANIRYSTDDSIRVAVLGPQQTLSFHDDWKGLYWEERITPAWRFIKSIKIGDNEIDRQQWSDEAAWHLRTEGGGRFEGESRYYDLWLKDM